MIFKTKPFYLFNPEQSNSSAKEATPNGQKESLHDQPKLSDDHILDILSKKLDNSSTKSIELPTEVTTQLSDIKDSVEDMRNKITTSIEKINDQKLTDQVKQTLIKGVRGRVSQIVSNLMPSTDIPTEKIKATVDQLKNTAKIRLSGGKIVVDEFRFTANASEDKEYYINYIKGTSSVGTRSEGLEVDSVVSTEKGSGLLSIIGSNGTRIQFAAGKLDSGNRAQVTYSQKSNGTNFEVTTDVNDDGNTSHFASASVATGKSSRLSGGVNLNNGHPMDLAANYENGNLHVEGGRINDTAYVEFGYSNKDTGNVRTTISLPPGVRSMDQVSGLQPNKMVYTTTGNLNLPNGGTVGSSISRNGDKTTAAFTATIPLTSTPTESPDTTLGVAIDNSRNILLRVSGNL